MQKDQNKLLKRLTLIDVFAAGAAISSGFFLLPGIAAFEAGPSFVLAYLLAAIPLIPAALSIIELATAMPKAGGDYFFLDRTLGPYFGTIGGLGTWCALILKVAFALIGMGAYISFLFPQLHILPVAIFFTILFGLLNIFGIKKSSTFQVIIVLILLVILTLFISIGLVSLHPQNFQEFWKLDIADLSSTTGLVLVAYIGVFNVVSLSEEIKNPEKNLPKGIFLTVMITVLIYVGGTTVMVGVIPFFELVNNLTPAATAAKYLFGKVGVILISLAAMFSFLSVANAGIMSASRYPLAMSRDHILPAKFRFLGKHSTPVFSLIITVILVLVIIIFLEPLKIAKLAGTFNLIVFILLNLAVIIIRESKIESYDPSFRVPFYPWTQIIGIIASFYLIFVMGSLSHLFSAGLIVLASLWYFFYVRKKTYRTGAIFHVFERLGQYRNKRLDIELREILKDRGLRAEDPFDEIVLSAKVLDCEKEIQYEEVVYKVSDYLSTVIPFKSEKITKLFLDGTKTGATPVTHGIALPHFRSDGVDQTILVVVRSKTGINIVINDPLTNEPEEAKIVNAIFFLVSPENDPARHLRILAQIAGRVDKRDFINNFLDAPDEEAVRQSLLEDEQCITLVISAAFKTSELLNKQIKDITIPQGCLITWLRKGNKVIVPKGSNILEQGDRLTIIGDVESLQEIKKRYK